MTAPKPKGYACHVDDDLAHVASRPQESPTPCSRRHAPVPHGAKPGRTLLPRTKVRLLDPITTRDQRATMDDPPPPKRPASPSSAARSTPKRVRRAGTPYSDRERAAAVAMLRGSGIAKTHAATGIPKATLSRWAKAEGIDLDEAARARTRAAGAAVEAKAAEVRLTTVDRLERILERELDALEARAALEQRVERLVVESDLDVTSGIAGPVYTPSDPQARDALAKLRLLADANPKRDTVGAATRAIHDLNLLKGEATERGAIVVRFGIPRPDAERADLEAVDEADLGASPAP